MKSTEELLSDAIAKKNKIIASRSNYCSRVWVVSEEKVRVCNWLKWVWERKDTSHWAEVFNHNLYNKHITEVESEINSYKSQIDDQDITIRYLNDSISSLSKQYSDITLLADPIRQKIDSDRNALINGYRNLDGKVRSFILSELFYNTDQASKISVEVIKSVGFDANDLAYLAIQNDNISLFDLALYYSADCSNYLINDQTLLQQASAAGKQDFIEKILERGPSLTNTLLNALKHNDTITIGKLISNNSNLAFEKFAGYTLLQLAITTKKTDVVETILSIEESVIDILSDNGESAFKIAVRSADENMVEVLSSRVNITQEISQLGSDLSFDEMESLQDTNDIYLLTNLLKRKIDLEKESLLKVNSDAHTIISNAEELNNALLEDAIYNNVDINVLSASVENYDYCNDTNLLQVGLQGVNLHIVDSL